MPGIVEPAPYDRTLSYGAAPIAVLASVYLADPAALVPRPHPPRLAAPVRARRELFSGGQCPHDLRIGFGHIVVSEIEAPNMLANLV